MSDKRKIESTGREAAESQESREALRQAAAEQIGEMLFGGGPSIEEYQRRAGVPEEEIRADAAQRAAWDAGAPEAPSKGEKPQAQWLLDRILDPAGIMGKWEALVGKAAGGSLPTDERRVFGLGDYSMNRGQLRNALKQALLLAPLLAPGGEGKAATEGGVLRRLFRRGAGKAEGETQQALREAEKMGLAPAGAGKGKYRVPEILEKRGKKAPRMSAGEKAPVTGTRPPEPPPAGTTRTEAEEIAEIQRQAELHRKALAPQGFFGKARHRASQAMAVGSALVTPLFIWSMLREGGGAPEAPSGGDQGEEAGANRALVTALLEAHGRILSAKEETHKITGDIKADELRAQMMGQMIKNPGPEMIGQVQEAMLQVALQRMALATAMDAEAGGDTMIGQYLDGLGKKMAEAYQGQPGPYPAHPRATLPTRHTLVAALHALRGFPFDIRQYPFDWDTGDTGLTRGESEGMAPPAPRQGAINPAMQAPPEQETPIAR